MIDRAQSMRLALWAALVAIFSIPLAAQAPQLTVTVTDATGGVLAGATVTLSNSSQQRAFTTGNAGSVDVRELPIGEWTLTVSRDGFATRQRPVVISGSSAAVQVALDIAPVQQTLSVRSEAPAAEPLRLDSSASGGTFLEIPIRDLPATLTVVTQDLIQERGVSEVMQAAELAGGVTTWVDSGSMPAFDTRGFSSTSGQIQVLRDGIRQNTVPQSGRMLDTFLIERVEVLKGPASLLYGEGAVGAAINLVTKEPRRDFEVDSLLSYGSWNKRRAGVGVSVPLTRTLAARIDASYADGGGYVDRTGARMKSITSSARWTAAENFTLKGTAVYTADSTSPYYGTPLVNGKIDPRMRFINYNMRDNLSKATNNSGKLTADLGLPGGWKLRNEFFAATQRADWRQYEGYSYNATTQRVTVSSYFLARRDDLLLGNQIDARKSTRVFGRVVDFAAGYTWKRNDQDRMASPSGAPTFSVDPFNPAPIFDPRLGYAPNRKVLVNTDTLFGESLLHLTNRLKFITGLRWERIQVDRTNTNVTPNTFNSGDYQPTTGRAGVVYTVTPTVNVYLSYSRATEPVTPLVSITGTQLEFSLTPSRQYEAGTKATFFRGRIDAALSYFDIEKENILTSTIIPETGERVNQQIGKQGSRGAELSFVARPFGTSGLLGGFSLLGDFLYTNAEYKTFNENQGATGVISRSGNDVPNVAPVIWSATPVYRIGPVTLSARVRNVGARWGDTANTARRAPYTTLDSSVSFIFPDGTRLTLTGSNLTDELYIPRQGGNAGRVAAPRGYTAQITKVF